MTGMGCSRAEKTQKGQLQLADQPLMLLAANFLGFEFSVMAVNPLRSHEIELFTAIISSL